jgi:dipeptidyl aminopeptidase/acylaminoacyl peptidase
MKWIYAFLSIFTLFSCQTKEDLILSKKKLDWKKYSFLYEKGEFKKEFEYLDQIDFYEVTYLSDGLKIESYAAVPKKEGKYPVIIYNRGGNRDFGVIEPFKTKRWSKPVATYFSKMASQGYIVMGCNYRGCGKSEGKDEFGGKDINDVLNLINVVDEFPKADTSAIGMFGWSRGGMMTFLTLCKTNKIKAAVVGGAPTDKTEIYRPIMENKVYKELIPNYAVNKEEELRKRSVLYFADKLPKKVPILILHGDNDQSVRVSEAKRLAKKLKELEIPHKLEIYKNGNHGLTNYTNEVDKEVMGWFGRFLGE